MSKSQIISIKAEAVKKVWLTLPTKVGDMAVLFSKQRFREQAWADNTTQPWKRRKAKNRGSAGRAILVKTGRLRRSIRIIRTSPGMVTIGSDVPYAQVHNDGFRGQVSVSAHTRNRYKTSREGTGVFSDKTGKERTRLVTSLSGSTQVKAHTRRMNMPRRRFMGQSAMLNKQIRRLISAEIMKALK